MTAVLRSGGGAYVAVARHIHARESNEFSTLTHLRPFAFDLLCECITAGEWAGML